MTTITATTTERTAAVTPARRTEAMAAEPPKGLADACLHIDAATRALASQRLRGAAGHLDGIVRMLQAPDVRGIDVLQQLKAVHGALVKASGHVLRSHVRDHVVTASERGDAELILDEIANALKYGR